MSLSGQRVRFETLRTVAFGGISGTYAALGSPLLHGARLIILDNLTNDDLLISFDGTNDHMVLVSTSAKIIDFASNKVGPVGQLELSKGTQVYVKQLSGAPTAGSVYLSVIYAAAN